MKIIAKDMFHPLIENPVKNDFELTNYSPRFNNFRAKYGWKDCNSKNLSTHAIIFKNGIISYQQETVEIFPFENIYFFGNDQQNLEAGLSSFSAEVTNYTKLLSST